MLGLIAIQIYWISNAIDIKESQFKQDVQSALVSVARGLEREEALAAMKKNEQGRRIMMQLDSAAQILRQSIGEPAEIALQSFQENGPQNWKEHFKAEGIDMEFDFGEEGSWENLITQNLGVKVEINDTSNEGEQVKVRIEQRYNEEPVQVFEQVEDFSNGETTLFFEDDERNERIHQTFRDDNGSSFMINGTDHSFMAELVIGDLIGSFFENSFLKAIEERVSAPQIDSLLTKELEDRGISADFNLGVYDAYNRPVIMDRTTKEKDMPLLNRSPFAINLFANDIVSSPNALRVYFPNQRGYLISTMWLLLVCSAIFILAIIFAFSYTISTIFRQKKISDIKNDFINNMTHELKTPISTISLACEALNDPDVDTSPQRMKTFVGMINDENKRLGVLVENVLRSAVLDRGELTLKRTEVDMHQVIRNAVKNVELQVNKKGGRIDMHLNAEAPIVNADQVHITNVIYNLLDNANKYTPETPEIKVETKTISNGLMVTVRDNGIGISRR